MRTALAVVAFVLSLINLTWAQDTVYTPGNGVSAPKLIKDVKPQYTAGALRRRVSGAVLMRCVVDPAGVPTRLELIKPLDDELDKVSLETLRQWRFEPGRKDGEAVPVQIEVTIAFSTDKKESWWRRIWR